MSMAHIWKPIPLRENKIDKQITVNLCHRSCTQFSNMKCKSFFKVSVGKETKDGPFIAFCLFECV